MMKVALLVWIVLGTTLAGCAVLVVLAVPSLSEQAWKLMLPASVAGFVVALPLSWIIAKQIMIAMKR
jgi:hypothetical protein